MSNPSEENIELYTQGSCHVFAAACVLKHGGIFLVASDSGSPHFSGEEDETDINEIIHVFAILQSADGGPLIVRDIRGDRLLDENQICEDLSDEYGVWINDVTLEEMSGQELVTLITDPQDILARALGVADPMDSIDHDDRPLHEVSMEDLSDATALPEVFMLPGSRMISEESAPHP